MRKSSAWQFPTPLAGPTDWTLPFATVAIKRIWSDQHHLIASLFDVKTAKRIENAQMSARVGDTGIHVANSTGSLHMNHASHPGADKGNVRQFRSRWAFIAFKHTAQLSGLHYYQPFLLLLSLPLMHSLMLGSHGRGSHGNHPSPTDNRRENNDSR